MSKMRRMRRDFGVIISDGTATNPSFSIRWQEGGKWRRKRGYKTKTEAAAGLARVRTQLADGVLEGHRRAIATINCCMARAPRALQAAAARALPLDAADIYQSARLGSAPLAGGEERCDVYLVADADKGAVKIGQASRGFGAHRIASLQTANSTRLECLAIVPGIRDLSEATLHGAFREARIRGEWFSSTPSLLAFAAFAVFAWAAETQQPPPRPGR